LTAYGINPVINSLLIDGIFAGVGAVLSFVPMLMGFGCSVPAVMATRTLASERDKKMTVFLTPFMSCGAKLPIYALFAAAFFPKNSALVMSSLYFLGIVFGVLSAFLMKKTIFKGALVPFVMELPNYRFPSVKTVLLLMWEKAKDFSQRAFTTILLATFIIWFLQSFDVRLNHVRRRKLAACGNRTLNQRHIRSTGFFRLAYFHGHNRLYRERSRYKHTCGINRSKRLGTRK